MEPYLWKTRPDGINVINIGKTWSVATFPLNLLGDEIQGFMVSERVVCRLVQTTFPASKAKCL